LIHVKLCRRACMRLCIGVVLLVAETPCISPKLQLV
jgi:hypothetical protein